METIATPVELVTSLAEFRFSPKLNAKLQDLMERNTEGQLSAAEYGNCASSAGKTEELHQVGNTPPGPFTLNLQ